MMEHKSQTLLLGERTRTVGQHSKRIRRNGDGRGFRTSISFSNT
ncbi:hypothetical protein PF010_g6063 [Phytophthora fragariae]|uniref:Uncharacterized protein n=1 Tax=Phytophthora fragariae TaxID=53985 RepID=A0A6A3G6X0_9STRA|nr:hypothetical protein PF003_g27162 [Phytophthora fragariae]KAE8949688.1 hypothetical protein PF009_g809 [Phytophthora fragariae]KAE8957707.1 hypothetical protein PF011_g31049 [Phytophthora fragariae]KAE9059399.1 hypothetical protein PF006_g31893 [Phytophthora fragariae]KAE9124308.1 hypothetical protein PF010_g6063 [Phytophthora fragariae]